MRELKNKYRVENEIAFIEVVSKGLTYEVMIDIADLERVPDRKLFVGQNGYAVFSMKNKMVLLHRFLMNFPKEQVDHINTNRLDNRSENLREVTNKENCNNPNNNYETGIAGQRGVTYLKGAGRVKRWCVRIKGKHYGYFHTKEEANQRAREVIKSDNL